MCTHMKAHTIFKKVKGGFAELTYLMLYLGPE